MKIVFDELIKINKTNKKNEKKENKMQTVGGIDPN